MMVERLVRWNMETETGEQERPPHRYTFAVVNKPSEIERIKQRIIEQLSPSGSYHVNLDLLVRGSDGIHCRIFSLSSEMGRIENPHKIYNNLRQFKRDRNLADKSDYELQGYAERLVV